MKSILLKEWQSFFYSPIGYLVIAVYLIINGLFLWVFNTDYNILQAGYADLSSYFSLAPWVLLFLIPAVTMKSFSEEYQSGTIEIIKTSPVTNWQLILGKYFGSLALILTAIFPTIIYAVSIYLLGNPVGNISIGPLIGSFIGLFFLASAYASIGIFTSAISKNQIISFITAVLLILFFYGSFSLLSNSWLAHSSYIIEKFGMLWHFENLAKGVIDFQDLIYFLSITVFFLFVLKIKLQYEN